MDHVSIFPADSIGRNFIPKEFLPAGNDEYYLRNTQVPWPKDRWRKLRADEIELLVQNNNTSDNWNDLLVTDPFDPKRIKNSNFFGMIRLGCIQNVNLKHHDLQVPAGISNSVVISCDIGDNVAIHNVRYLAHYIIGDQSMVLNVDEMHTTDHAKFGNGVLKEGEPESVRIWLELMNETGSRSVLPFDGMITADAYLWAKYRDDTALQHQLKAITQKSTDSRRGFYGTVGSQCVIKNSQILKDVKIGDCCYIKGANKLKNLTINSSEAESTQIGEGVELINGIIGYGCHIFYGSKAVRFILGNNSSLKYGARLIHSFLGDNSTISCCEVLNNLIFPAHEQHHNNSFLIASVVMGQSNLAAGATIGSNHNSRANDNEVQAGRGFWPGLCSSIKHSCRFASFVLLSKAAYPVEMDIPFPFSLLNNNESKDELEVMPAFWWMYNMYALARNTWKFQNRDNRKRKVQHIEFDSLAPDTVEEIFHACRLLELWTAKADLRRRNIAIDGKPEQELMRLGQELFAGPELQVTPLEVLGENMEKSSRKVIIQKAYRAYHAYQDMIRYYCVKTLLDYLKTNSNESWSTMSKVLANPRQTRWINLGGQLIPEDDVDRLRADIGSGKLATWEEIHHRYQSLWNEYPLQKQKHAFASFCAMQGTHSLTQEHWNTALDRAITIQEYIRDQVTLSRKKDFDNLFRQNTYRNLAEMTASIGTVEDNNFIQQVRTETDAFKKLVAEIRKRN
ncbi:MAG: DUF4954 family protein [Ignavibacteriae bacterium]|nr:MAG: DUF4954 family protein [Ignavibacteriota bacterium]